MENFFLNIGFSWTLSKVLPFAIMLILGLVIFYFVRRKLTKKLFRYLAFVIIPIPAALYLIASPIYEGDFANNFITKEKTEEFKELKNGHLAILTIPDCPFCYEALDNLKVIQERVGSNEKLDFIVCAKDEATLDWYKEKSNDKINVFLAKDPNALAKLAGGSFPCFAFVSNSGEIRLWSNDGFGVMAKDWVEGQL